MTNSQALILGVVQGLTEYLPVSSSAHLVLVPDIMGWQISAKESFIFDVLVQLGTMVGVLIYFYDSLRNMAISLIKGATKKDLAWDNDSRLFWLVILASIPAAIFGLSFKTEISAYFSSPLAACYFLVLTGLIMIIAELLSAAHKSGPSRLDAVIIGVAQSLALFPGVSRSGSTIAAGMTRGLSRRDAAKFSFLMSVPVMLGASLVALIDLLQDYQLFLQMFWPLIVGFVSAAISGYLVIKWFMAFLAQKPLSAFSAYCIGVGVFGIYFYAF